MLESRRECANSKLVHHCRISVSELFSHIPVVNYKSPFLHMNHLWYEATYKSVFHDHCSAWNRISLSSQSTCSRSHESTYCLILYPF